MNNKIGEYFLKIKGKKILLQGLGLNGGGVGTAKFFLENKIPIVITDLKTTGDLSKSIDELSPYKELITYVLGEHRESDFANADIVVKGPGVPLTNKFIQIAKSNGAQIISDIEIFATLSPVELYSLTGSKGKSSTVSGIYNIFKTKTTNSFLGGNITISPLSFYKDLDEKSLVILELSSWQLRDIKNKNINFKGTGITNLLNDHQNYYTNMNDYLIDKAIITENQTSEDFLILPYNDKFLNTQNIKTKAKIYYISNDNENADFYYKNGIGYFKDKSGVIELFDSKIIKIPGDHNKLNLLFAAGFCYLCGIEKKYIIDGLSTFKGVPFRLELVREWNGIKFINDTTATIPEAAVNALRSFTEPVIWIGGGTDKNLDFSIIKDVSDLPKKIFLLKGTGTDKMKNFINRDDIIEDSSLENLLNKAISSAKEGDIILLSPGSTSFGLFQNEFHRGEVFNNLVKNLK